MRKETRLAAVPLTVNLLKIGGSMYTAKDYSAAFSQVQRLEKGFYLGDAIPCIEMPCYSFWNGAGPKPAPETVLNSLATAYESGRSNLDILLMPTNDLLQKLENFVALMSQLESSYDRFMRNITQIIEKIKKSGYSKEADEALCNNLNSLKKGVEIAASNICCSDGKQNMRYQSCIDAVDNAIYAMYAPCASFLKHRTTCVQSRCGTTLPDYAIVKMNFTDTFLSASGEMKPHLRTMRTYVTDIEDILRREAALLQKILDSAPARHIQDTEGSINDFKSCWEELIKNIKR